MKVDDYAVSNPGRGPRPSDLSRRRLALGGFVRGNANKPNDLRFRLARECAPGRVDEGALQRLSQTAEAFHDPRQVPGCQSGKIA